MTPKRKITFTADILPYLTAFLIPVLMMVIVLIQRQCWPFGDQCFLRTDLYHQYAPFFKELKRKLAEGGSLFYSWNIGGGTNFWAIIAYYLASPLNFTLLFCPSKYVIEYITAWIIIKEGLCSVTLTYYLNYKGKKRGLAAYPAVFFGIFYALSGYMCAYQWNIMWLDCLWLFPLVILGLERLVRENKGLLYGFTLGLTILSNYYIAIMVCIGIACYCFFLLGTEPEMRKHFAVKLLKFTGYTLLAFAFAAALLLPYIHYFSMTASSTSSFSYEWYSYFSVFDMLSRQLMNVDVHIGLDHWPNIYCGVAIFICIPLYYLNKRILLREKIGYTILLIFFYFSFSTRSMDYIWHVFHIPNSLPCRQSFIYIFILLAMSYRGFEGIRERTYRDLTFCMIAALVFIFAAEKLETDTEFYHMYTFYASAVFVIIYVICAYLYRKGRVYTDLLLVTVLAIGAIEACINTSVTSIPTVTRTDYVSFDAGMDELEAEIDAEEGGNFYRMEKVKYRTKNDGAWLGFRSISTFSSVANANLQDFYTTLGLEASMNAYGSMGQTPFTNMLMDVKYSVTDTELPVDDKLYTLYDEADGVYVYENKYVLPLGYLLNAVDFSLYSSYASSPLENQNRLAESISGVSDLFLDVTPQYTQGTTVTITVPQSGWYYAYSTTSGPKKINVTHASTTDTFSNLNRGYTMVLGYLSAGTVLTFENKDDDATRLISLSLYLFQEDLMDEVYEAFSENTMTVDSFTDTSVTAHIDCSEYGTLLTTIPYEEGWTVWLDGQKVEYDCALDAYISLDLDAGSHTLVFKYHVPWFAASLVISIIATCIYAGIFAFTIIIPWYRRRKTIPALPESPEPPDDDFPDEEPLPAEQPAENL